MLSKYYLIEMTYEILKELADKGLSRKQIADSLNLKFDSVNYNLRKFKIETKGFSAIDYNCECGETNPTQFYGKQKTTCKACQVKDTHARMKENKIKAIEHKGGKCEKCGYNKCVAALEFHHLGDKNLDPNKALQRKWEIAKKEIDKCILVCSNCHREIHQNTGSMGEMD